MAYGQNALSWDPLKAKIDSWHMMYIKNQKETHNQNVK